MFSNIFNWFMMVFLIVLFCLFIGLCQIFSVWLDNIWTVSIVNFLVFYNIPLQVFFISIFVLCFYLYNLNSLDLEQHYILKALAVTVFH